MLETRKREIRRSSELLRENYKVGRYGIIDLFRECERLGFKLFRYPMGEDGDLGLALKRDEDIIIVINTSIRMSREIFTLAHEIGHAVLHLNNENHFVDTNATLDGRNENEKEQEANYFAACLLMPADVVDRYFDLELPDFEEKGLSGIDIARIMSEFCVSYDMVLNRLEDLGKIDGRQKLVLDTEKNEKRVGNLLVSIGGNSRLNTIGNEIDIPYEYIEYALYNYNHNAVPAETLKRILAYYKLCMEDVSDRLADHVESEDDLDDLIGGLHD